MRGCGKLLGVRSKMNVEKRKEVGKVERSEWGIVCVCGRVL